MTLHVHQSVIQAIQGGDLFPGGRIPHEFSLFPSGTHLAGSRPEARETMMMIHKEKQSVVRKVLIVDDDPNFRKVLEQHLSDMGFEVEGVCEGQSAVRCCKDEDYALIVADVNVPTMRVLSFLSLIRLRRPRTPIMVLSAFASMENVAIAFRFGANDFMEKPFDMAALGEKIRNLLSS